MTEQQVPIAETEDRLQDVTPPEIPNQEALLAEVEELAAKMRDLIVRAKPLKLLDVGTTRQPHLESKRSLGLAQDYLQTGFLWLRRAIQRPQVF